MNADYNLIIEKKAENLYRTISQKVKSLPTSNLAVKQSVLRTQQMNLTPQESEQLSKYVSDDTYVKTQKEDIEQLASMFKDMLDNKFNLLAVWACNRHIEEYYIYQSIHEKKYNNDMLIIGDFNSNVIWDKNLIGTIQDVKIIDAKSFSLDGIIE